MAIKQIFAIASDEISSLFLNRSTVTNTERLVEEIVGHADEAYVMLLGLPESSITLRSLAGNYSSLEMNFYVSRLFSDDRRLDQDLTKNFENNRTEMKNALAYVYLAPRYEGLEPAFHVSFCVPFGNKGILTFNRRTKQIYCSRYDSDIYDAREYFRAVEKLKAKKRILSFDEILRANGNGFNVFGKLRDYQRRGTFFKH